MSERQKLVVIDIGSHKLEELSVLVGPFTRQYGVYLKWMAKKIVKALLRADLALWPRFRRQCAVLKYYFLTQRVYDLQVISIEPNVSAVQPFVNKLSRVCRVHYMPVAVLGHDAVESSALKTLYFYDASISSSIYQKDRPADNAKSRVCVGVKFDVIWDGLVREGILHEDDPFVLRMNCEGAELGVIECCHNRGLKPECIIGSLGDVDKIHGQQMGDKTRRLMEEMGTPYFYFKGDDPSTWHGMIPVWERYVSPYRARG